MSQIPSIAAATAALLLAGCAASHAPLARVTPAGQASAVAADPQAARLAANAAYMARVEEVARRRGIAVQWVHPPVTRVVVAD